jgi:hypothetical protein
MDAGADFAAKHCDCRPLDARTYCSYYREHRTQWQRAAELLPAPAILTETFDSFAALYGNVVELCGQFSDFLKDGCVRFLSKIGDLSTLGTRGGIDAVQSTDYFFRSVTAVA